MGLAYYDELPTLRRIMSIEWDAKGKCPACHSTKLKGHKQYCWIRLYSIGSGPKLSKGCSACEYSPLSNSVCRSGSFFSVHEKAKYTRDHGHHCPFYEAKKEEYDEI